MAESLTVTSDRIDDTPVLLAQLERMGLAELLDARFPLEAAGWRHAWRA